MEVTCLGSSFWFREELSVIGICVVSSQYHPRPTMRVKADLLTEAFSPDSLFRIPKRTCGKPRKQVLYVLSSAAGKAHLALSTPLWNLRRGQLLLKACSLQPCFLTGVILV